MTVTLVTLLDRRFTLNNVLLRLLEPLALCVITGGSDCYWTREWASLFPRYSSLLIDLLNSLLQGKPSFQHGKRETKEEDTIIIVRSAIYHPPPAPLSPKEEGNPGSFRHNVCAGISTTFPPNWSTLFDFVCQLSPVYPLFFFWGATFLSLCRWIGHLTSGQTHRRIPTSKSFKMLYWFVSLMSSRECFPLNIEPIDSIANVAEQLL